MSKDYKDTMNLPKTDFPMKANLPQNEPLMLKHWDDIGIYEKMIGRRQSSPRYVFHDGPPYANGHIHLGTILNKILKDIVVKYQNMKGSRCDFVPGWDCHGLPIELEVDKQVGDKKGEMKASDFRLKCREHAKKFMSIQREEFKRLGCLGRWNEPYLTMSNHYESTIAKEFGKFFSAGNVYQAKRPIYWCTSCQTALAEAEVEYEDHASPSIYVKFLLDADDDLRRELNVGDEDIYILIWTTTPWTLPANMAVALHPGHQYAAVKTGGEIWIAVEELLGDLSKRLGKEFEVKSKFKAGLLEKRTCSHPLVERRSLVILGEYVTMDVGTGIVHIAPGHGQEDYQLGLRYGIDVFSPVDERGCFTDAAKIDWLTGVFVEKANPIIIEHLKEKGLLLKSEKVDHSYPHCWRCKRPVIFRATKQWFISVEKNDLRKKATEQIDKVEWFPTWSKNRIGSMVAERPDWCVSRQRLWGVPIVAVHCKSCGEPILNSKLIENAVSFFEKETSDSWFIRPVSDFVPNDLKCPKCGSGDFEKEYDILDVWFDSGVSYAAVIEGEGIKDQIDLYLEGSDQHRGWFQTSLLASVGTRGRSPYKRVLTHGFIVDGQGKKYSKSQGNYVPPEELIKKHGVEILRLWVASEDYREDIRFSDEILTRCIEAYRKIRNTCRFMLANLFDFNPVEDKVPDEKLLEIDRWALMVFDDLLEVVLQAYETFEFHKAYQAINRFCTVELSSFYFDIIKDRLYAEKADGIKRRSSQTVLYKMLRDMTTLLAPILSFTSEEVWKYMPKEKLDPESVFISDIAKPSHKHKDEKLLERWNRLLEVRPEIMKSLELARAAKFIGNPLEASVVIEAPEELKKFLHGFGEGLGDLFIVSGVKFDSVSGDFVHASEKISGLKTSVEKASGSKCARCWKYSATVGTDARHADICSRCAKVVEDL